ncbi:MAG: M3 family oligoendopeptidase [Lewinella sp.]|nr:M3 family oligoendopeptidase [Lewinella sp.]
MRATATTTPSKSREFIPPSMDLQDWAELKVYYDNLLDRQIGSAADLEQWIQDRNDLDAAISETFAWCYIHITVDSSDDKAMELYQHAVQELSPRIASCEDDLNRKLVNSPFINQLPKPYYNIYLRNIQNAVDLFRQQNIPLATDVQLRSKEHGRIFSEMTIGVNGRQMTLQKAGALLEETDRICRENVYHKINQRILQDTSSLEALFNDLLAKRHQIALNAGYENFRDYKFRELGRFDYTVEQCLDFHESIQHEVLPLVDELNEYRQNTLGLGKLRPWDLHVDTSGQAPLRPFSDTDELVDKSIQCLTELHPFFGKVISIMKEMGHLDLDSRKGKRPGGYNMPLMITGVPFIFMNATHTLNDMRTFLHESGHAIHSYLTKDQQLAVYKRVPSEVAELAAMTMELLTMDHWDMFFSDAEDLRRAKIAQLENVLKVLPWIATIDKFQHWLYTHPNHTSEERRQKWMEMLRQFSSDIVDSEGLEHYSEYIWHKQLHIFEVPFYYIEYGMAQLGAIAIWKRFREEPEQAIRDYINALKLGYTKPIHEIYATAGIAFDFSREYVAELGAFVKHELHKLIHD